MYASFKHDEGESVREGRFFSDYREKDLEGLVRRHAELALRKIWTTAAARTDRADQRWINVLLSKGN